MKLKLLFVFAFSLAVSLKISAQCSFSGLSSSYQICNAPVTLTGSPSGGTFSGNGVSGNTFDPQAAGIGTFNINYTAPVTYQAIPSCCSSVPFLGWLTVPLGDDQVSGALPIGFNFKFYENTYSQFVISSNGFISFDLAAPNGCCTGQLLPNGTTPNNLIAAYWEDLAPNIGGTIGYQTTGIAPFRKLQVHFSDVPHYPSGNLVNFQIVLYETTNVIEIATNNCTSDGGLHTQGLDNLGGTSAVTYAGRNNANFSTSGIDVVTFQPIDCISTQSVTVTGTSCPSNIAVSNTAGLCAANVGYSTPVNCIGGGSSQVTGLPSGSNFPVGVTTNNFNVTYSTPVTSITTANGGGGTFTYNYGDSPQTVAFKACESVYGTGNCVAGSCGSFTYYYRSGHLTCNCGKTEGQMEFVYSNSGYTDVGQDYGGTNEPLGTTGFGLPFVRVKGPNGCSVPNTWQIADNNLNESFSPVGSSTSSCSFTVTVSDAQAPTLACPANQTLVTAAGVCTQTYTISDPITDNCGVSTWGYTLSGATTAGLVTRNDGQNSVPVTFNKGITTVTLSGTDGTNSATGCSFTVTVNDNQAPVVTCPANQTLTTAAGVCTQTYTIADPIADNCTGATWGYTLSGVTTLGPITGVADGSGSGPLTFNKGVTTVTLSGTDGTNSATGCSFTVTVNDNQAPVLTCPSNQTLTTAAGVCTQTYTVADPIADNCTGSTWGYTLSGVTALGPITGVADGSGSGALTFNKGVTTVTLSGTDGTNSATGCSFTVTVNDNQAPVLTCPANQTLTTAAGVCTQTYTVADPIADNCTGSTWGYTLSGVTTLGPVTGVADGSGSGALTYNIGVTTVTLTGTDGTNSATGCSFTVTVSDGQAPVVTCPANQTLTTTAGLCTQTYTVADPIADNCTGSTWGYTLTGVTALGPVTGVADGSGSGALTFNKGITTVTLSGTDGTNSAAGCSFTVTVNDNQAPVVTCPANQSLTTAAGVCTQTYTIADPIADNCTGATWGYTLSGVTVLGPITGVADGTGSGALTFNKGVTTVTLSGTDGTNSATGCSFTVTVSDNEIPVVTNPGNQSLSMAAGLCNQTYTIADPITDNCTGATWGYTLSGATTLGPIVGVLDGTGSGAIAFNPGVTTVTLGGIDGSSNIAATTSFTVTVSDNQAPTLTCPANQSLVSGAGCSQTYNIADPVSDNCTGSTWGYTLSGATILGPVTGIADGAASGTVTFNSGVTTVSVSGTDGTNAATNCSFTVTVSDGVAPVTPTIANATGECSVTPSTPTTTDNCSGIVFGTTPTTFPITAQGTTVVTWTFTDGNGNSTIATQNIIIDDITAPATPTLANATGECSVTPTPPTTTDNCVGTVTGTTSTTFPITSQGTTVVTWTFDDGNGNTITANQNVVVDDVTAPVTPTLANATGECSVTPVAPTTTDNCVGTVTGTTVTTFPITSQGTTVVTWTFNDGNGNITTANQNVVVDDVTAPVTPTLANATGECSVTPSTPTTTDNCVGTVTGTTVTTFPITAQGTTVVIWTFNDGNGNITTANQNVIVDDVTAPATPTLADATGECSVTPVAPTTTDNCVGTVTGTTVTTFPITSQGTTVVTWTFNDGNGNTTTANQNVIVDDVTAPVAPTLADATGECSATPNTPTATDNCAGTITGTTTTTFPISTQGTTVVTWTFDDGNGNTITANQNVVVADVTDPVADAASLPTLTGCSVNVSTVPTATDNCAGTINGTTTDPLSYTVAGGYTVTWTFDDGNGNTSTQTQTVTVIDCSGISEVDALNVSLYPNPSNGIFTLSLNEMPKGNITMKLLDALGQTLYANAITSQSTYYDFSYLKAGTYFVQITTERSSFTKTIIVTQQY